MTRWTTGPLQGALRLLGIVAIAVGTVLAAPVARGEERTDTRTADIEVITSDAEANFPEHITFELEAESDEAKMTEVSLLYGSERGDARTVVELDIEPGQTIAAEHVLNTQIHHLPVGVDVVYSWLIRDADGNEFETDEQQLVYHDTRFDWQERTVRDVTVYWYEGGADFGAALIDTAVETLDLLQAEIGATVEDPIKIYVYANTADMRGALRSNSVEWVGGQAVPGLGLIIGTVAPGDDAELGRIIPHELSHQVLHQATENPYGGMPLWFDEGLAVHNQQTPDTFFPMLVEEAAVNGELIPLEALAASFPADPQRALLSYAQSHSVVEYIIDTYGTESTAALVDAFANATPVEDAIPEVLDMTVDELDAEWRATLPAARVEPDLEGSPSVAPADRFSLVPAAPQQGDAPQPVSTDAPTVDERATAVEFEPSAAQIEHSEQPLTTPAPPATAAPVAGSPGMPELVVIGAGVTGMVVVTGAVLLIAVRLAHSGDE